MIAIVSSINITIEYATASVGDSSYLGPVLRSHNQIPASTLRPSRTGQGRGIYDESDAARAVHRLLPRFFGAGFSSDSASIRMRCRPGLSQQIHDRAMRNFDSAQGQMLRRARIVDDQTSGPETIRLGAS